MTDGKRNIIKQLLAEYDIKSAQDIQDALKDLLGGTIKEMMEAEMNEHLGYCKSERSENDDYRNVYKTKQVNSSYGMKRFVKCFFELLTQILVKVRKCKVQRVCVLHFQLAGSGGCFFLMKLYH